MKLLDPEELSQKSKMGSYMPNGVNFAPVLKVLKDTNAQE